MMNWMIRMTEQSQSENCLAVSGDFSGNDSVCGNDLEVESLIEEEQFIKQRLSSSASSASSSVSTTATAASLKSRTVSSLSLNLSHPNSFSSNFYTLPFLKRWLVLPACTLTFMVVLPFINGCLYTIGYRIGKRVLKIILNKSIKN